MKNAAISYYTDERLPKNVGDSESMTLSDMIGKHLIIALIDKNNKAVDVEKSYVKITKSDDEYLLKVNIKDSEKEDYILVHLGCYTYCESDVCAKKDTQVNIKDAKPQDNVVVRPQPTPQPQPEPEPAPAPVVEEKEVTRAEKFEVIEEQKDVVVLKKYHVVIGSFGNKDNALRLQAQMKPQYEPIIVINEKGMYRVLLMTYDTYKEAKTKIAEVRDQFPDAWVLVMQNS